VTMFFAEAFPALHFKRNHFVALPGAVQDLSLHSCRYGAANFKVVITVYQQNVAQFHLVAGITFNVGS
jgi:hypothetical protein